MDKKQLEERLKQLQVLEANHAQDIVELEFVIEGLKKQIKNLKE